MNILHMLVSIKYTKVVTRKSKITYVTHVSTGHLLYDIIIFLFLYLDIIRIERPFPPTERWVQF